MKKLLLLSMVAMTTLSFANGKEEGAKQVSVQKANIIGNNIQEFELVFHSEEFLKISKKFNISMDEIHFFEKVKTGESSSLLTFRVIQEGETSYLNVFEENGEFPLMVFEKINLGENSKVINHYDSEGNNLIEFRYKKDENNKISEEVIFNESNSSSRGGETYLECVRRIVKVMQDACNQNTTCSIMCDLMNTQCVRNNYMVAAARCLVDRVDDVN